MPKKTVEAIIETNNNYIIGVKKNQTNLYKNIEAITSEDKMVCSKFVELLKNRGRTERRTVWVYSGTDKISSAWAGVKQLIKVHRWVKEKGRIREEYAFFISSLIGNAQTFCYAIKSHWGIENSLHWVKDVTFNEDSSRIRTSNAPENTSVFRNIVINVFRINDYSNLAQAQRLVCNDINKLKQLLN